MNFKHWIIRNLVPFAVMENIIIQIWEVVLHATLLAKLAMDHRIKLVPHVIKHLKMLHIF